MDGVLLCTCFAFSLHKGVIQEMGWEKWRSNSIAGLKAVALVELRTPNNTNRGLKRRTGSHIQAVGLFPQATPEGWRVLGGGVASVFKTKKLNCGCITLTIINNFSSYQEIMGGSGEQWRNKML